MYLLKVHGGGRKILLSFITAVSLKLCPTTFSTYVPAMCRYSLDIYNTFLDKFNFQSYVVIRNVECI